MEKKIPDHCMRLKIENTEKRFRVHVLVDGKEIYDCAWHGGHFKWEAQDYMVLGPYHGLEGLFRVYKIEPATDPT